MTLIDVFRDCMAVEDKMAWLHREEIDPTDFALLVAHVVRQTESAILAGALSPDEALSCAVAASFQTAWEASRVAPR